MARRRALLIGAEQYGHGFNSLPAAPRDVAILDKLLSGCGYTVEICDSATTRSASALDKKLRDFCTQAGRDDVHIVYFSGHGVSVGDVDYIVPAATSRSDAESSAAQRVSTDLRGAFGRDTGLVVFIIDACRDPRDSPTAAEREGRSDGHGDGSRQPRFIRFFGCRAGEFCQVLPGTAARPEVSLFSRAVDDAVTARSHATLQELLPDVQERCLAMSNESGLKPQTPRLSVGELSAEMQALLNRPILDPPPEVLLPSVWQRFEPNGFHCAVIISEHDTRERPSRDLDDVVRDALSGESGQKIWTSFRQAVHGQYLVSEQQRVLSDGLDPGGSRVATFNVVDALASEATLDRAVRAIVEADLAVFDVTKFEPAVMLLIGVRAACARGVTICSHGGGWVEGTPLDIPFNLQNLSILSHTPPDTYAGEDPVVTRFVERVVKGYAQLWRHGHYLDLPAYDDLRQLGARYEAASTIGVQEGVLVLCSYRKEFFPYWQYVRSGLKKAMWTRKLSPRIERIIDHGTPQLVSQALCEQLRRAAACVIDWSEYSASAFMELGIRLAVSSWGAVHLVERQYLPSGSRAPALTQVERLVRVFNPIPYAYRSDDAPFETAVASLVDRTSQVGVREDVNRLHAVAVNSIGIVHRTHQPVFEELREAADSLHHQQQEKEAVPQILFYGSYPLKIDSERAALERRIAAWLYLEHRLKAGGLAAEDPLRTLHGSLGRAAVSGLYDRGAERDLQLASVIEAKLSKDPLRFVAEKQQAAAAARKKGDRLRELKDEAAAVRAFRLGVRHLDKAIEVLRGAPWYGFTDFEAGPEATDAAREFAELLGTRAGLKKRLGEAAEALSGYAEGAAVERRFHLLSTYNRLNHLKQRLMTGTPLGSLEPELREIVASIEKQLRPDSGAGDSGWAWGDLADCRALLNDLAGAERAYVAFIAKSSTKSPERALQTLRQLAATLEAASDPGAARVQAAVQYLEERLAAV